MTKDEFTLRVADWIVELRLDEKAEKTWRKYEQQVKSFINSIHHMNEVSKMDVLRFKEGLMTTGIYEPTTINSYMVAVNKFLYWCDLGDLRVLKLKIQDKYNLESVVSPNEYGRLLRFAKQEGRDDIYMIMKTIALTGIRVSELKIFTAESIAEKSFTMRIRSKGKDRLIPIRQELIRELRRYAKTHRIVSGPLFEMPLNSMWRSMKHIAGAARIDKDKVHAHSFRHLFAKMYMDQFNNPIELADILGHSSIETTRIYSRATLEEQRHKIEQINYSKGGKGA